MALLRDWRGQPVGEQARRVVALTTIGSWVLAILVSVVGAFRPFDPPYWAFGLPALVPLGALVVLWDPRRRVENAWLHLFFGAFLLGLFAAAWAAFWALPVAALTLLGMLVAPKERSRSGKRART